MLRIIMLSPQKNGGENPRPFGWTKILRPAQNRTFLSIMNITDLKRYCNSLFVNIW